MGVVLNYPRQLDNVIVWNAIANLTSNVTVNDGRKKVEVSCSLNDLNAVANALRTFKKYYKELSTSQKDQSATVIIKTNFEYEARNIGADILAIQDAGEIVIVAPKKEGDGSNGGGNTGQTAGGQTIYLDGRTSQEDLDKQKSEQTINTIFSKRNIIIVVVVIVIGIVGYIIYKKKFSKK
jgi:hypothetical protein